MSNMHRVFAVLAVCTLVSTHCIAATVSGTVLYDDLTPVDGADVSIGVITNEPWPIEGARTQARWRARTDAQGNFHFTDVDECVDLRCFVRIPGSGSRYLHVGLNLGQGQELAGLDFTIPRAWANTILDPDEARLAVIVKEDGSPLQYAFVSVVSDDLLCQAVTVLPEQGALFHLLPEGKYTVRALNGGPVADEIVVKIGSCVVELPASGKVTVELDLTDGEEHVLEIPD